MLTLAHRDTRYGNEISVHENVRFAWYEVQCTSILQFGLQSVAFPIMFTLAKMEY